MTTTINKSGKRRSRSSLIYSKNGNFYKKSIMTSLAPKCEGIWTYSSTEQVPKLQRWLLWTSQTQQLRTQGELHLCTSSWRPTARWVTCLRGQHLRHLGKMMRRSHIRTQLAEVHHMKWSQHKKPERNRRSPRPMEIHRPSSSCIIHSTWIQFVWINSNCFAVQWLIIATQKAL